MTPTKTTSGPVPRLRFPEFKTDWKLESLATHLEECGFKVAATTSIPIYSSSRAGLTPQSSYYDGHTLANEGEYGVVPPNAFVYRHMSDDGRFAFNINDTGSEVAVSKEYPVFRTVDLNSRFLLSLLNGSPTFKAFALSQKTGGTRTRLYFSKLREWRTFLPTFAEQKKIADCLTSLDEVIAAQGRKVEALKAHKRGLMQQLFPRNGETRPRLRFPEFRDAPEWESAELGRLAEFISGGTPSKANAEFWNGDIPWVSAKDMKAFRLSDAEDHIASAAVAYGAKVVPANTLLILTRGMTLLRDVPVCILDRRMSFNQDVKALLPKENVQPVFLAFLLLANKSHLLNMVDVAGHGTGKLDTVELKSLDLSAPTMQEQQRIADCLTSLDSQITAETAQLAALKTHKQGLMQQLFPAPEPA